MNSESVDLIYLDPPFHSNQDYAAPIGSEAAGASYKDAWKLTDVHDAWHGEMAEQQPAPDSILSLSPGLRAFRSHQSHCSCSHSGSCSASVLLACSNH